MLIGKSTSEVSNSQIINIYRFELRVLEEQYLTIGNEILILKNNADQTLNHLKQVRADIETYIEDKKHSADVFWRSVRLKCGQVGDRWKKLKAQIMEELKVYLDFLEVTIESLKNYVKDMFAFKDEIQKFLYDLRRQLEPINAIMDAVNTVTFGALGDLVFQFPAIPAFPTMPTIDWKKLKPDLSGVQAILNDQYKQLKLEADIILSELHELVQPPDLDLEFLSGATLRANYLDPIVRMGSVMQGYWGHLKDSQKRVNDALLERKKGLQPYGRALILAMVFWLVLSFISYLGELRQNLVRAVAMIRGIQPHY